MQNKLARQFHTSITAAHWQRHINALQAPSAMSDWLTNRDSLTARLMAHSKQFRVQRLFQGQSMCLRDEYAQIDLVRPQRVIEREVLLRCDEVPVVYAHTVLPRTATADEWPLFASLGNRSLGTTLFNDPLVHRGQLQFARLRLGHPLMRKIVALNLLSEVPSFLYARRSVFTRHGAKLLVTEVFLPTMNDLQT